ncbi:serine hydrolase domain-containing protein [Mycobacterium sp. Marseille-P9652]|uniref:serine hydrolase domain-containing protein n=1 Tax=Mycobacterium sp. Marseille-P9652 TaxID=2654950 RepID=UPI001E406162|nr:serine hydrolase domain-containing protein [Mycobacterium sp. Marseille-P9652]
MALWLVGGGAARAPAPATPGPQRSTQHDQARARSQRVLDDAVGDLMARTPGCSAAVGVRGQVEWTGVAGVADTATGAPITTRTVFDIASVSKQFTATAALLLIGDGKLALGDPLSRHLPELPAWAAGVTVEQLMHQTSGIPDYVGVLEGQGFSSGDRTTEEQALQAVADIPRLDFAPGSQFEYSNSNYLLLGEIVHRVARVPLAQFLSAEIFRPLGLDMVLDPTGSLPAKAIAYEAYEKDGGGYRASISGWEQVGDGGIQTTPSQLVVWGDNYRTGRVGGSELLEAQLAGAVPTGPDRYGAGIYLMADGSLDHDGIWSGFVTAFRVSKDRATSVAVSCNTDKQDAEALAGALAAVWVGP